MRRLLIYSVIGILLLSGVIAGIGLSNVSDTTISKECYNIMQEKGVTSPTLEYLYEKDGKDYFRIHEHGKVIAGFKINSTLTETTRTTRINEEKTIAIERWCKWVSYQDTADSTEKYEDVQLNLQEGK